MYWHAIKLAVMFRNENAKEMAIGKRNIGGIEDPGFLQS